MPANGASVSSQMGTRKKKSSGVYQLQISRCIMKSSHSLSLGCWCGLAISLYTIRRLCDFIVLQKAVNCCCKLSYSLDSFVLINIAILSFESRAVNLGIIYLSFTFNAHEPSPSTLVSKDTISIGCVQLANAPGCPR